MSKKEEFIYKKGDKMRFLVFIKNKTANNAFIV